MRSMRVTDGIPKIDSGVVGAYRESTPRVWWYAKTWLKPGFEIFQFNNSPQHEDHV